MELANVVLKESGRGYGGKLHFDETVGDFIQELQPGELEAFNSLQEFNSLLEICGLLPLNQENYVGTEITERTYKNLLNIK